ncbi:MAG: hypothetical protein ACYCU7_03430 [Acidimicrobiales bacterium]
MTEPPTAPTGRRPVIGPAAAIIGGAVLAVWEGGQARQTAAAHWSVAAVVMLGLVVAVVAGRRRQRQPSRPWLTDAASGVRSAAGPEGWRRRPGYVAGVVAWVLLIAAVAGWDLNSFAHQAHDLPTLSYFVGKITRYRWGRSGVFAGWLAVGSYAAVGWRRRAPAPSAAGEP